MTSRLHEVQPTPRTVHLGGFSAELKPAITIESGDRISVQTISGYYLRDVAPDAFVTPTYRQVSAALDPASALGPGPHLLTGPIEVRGAQVGDVLEVDIESVSLACDVGFNAIRSGWGVLAERFATPKIRWIVIDRARRVAEYPVGSGCEIPLRPFFGILGVGAPGGARSSIPPGAFGGNVDLRDLTAGAKLFLPVLVPGVMFSVGDGHAAQGDGEVDVTAIETHLNGVLKLSVRKGLSLASPVALTSSDVIVLGFGATLDDALKDALSRTIDLLVRFAKFDAEDAYVFCSVSVSFRVTQAVNAPVKGVHAVVPRAVLPKEFAI